jgi:F0F1-type ATP synthase beta subunit
LSAGMEGVRPPAGSGEKNDGGCAGVGETALVMGMIRNTTARHKSEILAWSGAGAGLRR